MSENKYNHKTVENNWRDHWFKDNIYEAVDFDKRPKQYILAELPYPSGPFLHVGHMMRYTVPDVYSRYLRMKGFNVMFPMGWDCFGLPAETYAIKEGKTPPEVIDKAIQGFKESMQQMGYGIDWAREVNTSDPKFYKWTQWMFLELYKKGLAELKEMPVWWCKELGVLADEEVLPGENGEKVSERGGYSVQRKMYKQWVLKITDYADRLLEDLDKTDYTEPVKEGQRNWIGRSIGAEVQFEIDSENVSVFTTRPDTLFGVTFMAVAPEHHMIAKLLDKVENRQEVEEYIERAKSLSDLEKQTKEKTGVEMKGITVKHPLPEVKHKIPLFVADYILLDYGTGVVMGVGGHDERDFEFAKKYNLDVIEVVEPPKSAKYEDVYTGEGTVKNSGEYDGMNSEEFKKVIIERLSKESKGKVAKTYKIRDQIFSRQRYWGEPIPLMYRQDGSVEIVDENDLPVELPVMKDFLPGEGGESPLKRAKDWLHVKDSEGNDARRETQTMPTWAGSNWYYIRYIDPNNDETFCDYDKMKYWLPVDKYFGDAGHTTAHLMYTRFWVKALHDLGHIPQSEPIYWRMSGGLLLGEDKRKMSKSRPKYVVDPKDLLEKFGADASRMVLCFLGPYDETYPWNPNSVKACYRVLNSIYDLQSKVVDNVEDDATAKMFNKFVKNVTEMYENIKMNTAVSEIMTLVNHFKKVEAIDKEMFKSFIKMIAPITPYIAEELWQSLNGYTEWKKENSVHLQEWPEYDDSIKEDTVEIAVQVNGKVRGTIEISYNANEEEVVRAAKNHHNISKYLDGVDIKKKIYIKNKVLNLVI